MRKETKRQCVQEGGRQEGEGDKEVLRKEESEWPMAKEKNEHNDKYMTLKRLKRHGTLYSQEKQELLTHIGCHCKYTHENDSYLDNVQGDSTVCK